MLIERFAIFQTVSPNLFQSHNTIMHINQNYITKSVFHNNLIVRCFCHLEDYEAIKICL